MRKRFVRVYEGGVGHKQSGHKGWDTIGKNMNPLKTVGVINLNKSNIKASQGGRESGTVQPKDSGTFLLVAVETGSFPPMGRLRAAAADALRPGYAFFLFPAFPLPRNPLRCISTARDIVLVSLTAPGQWRMGPFTPSLGP